MKTWKRLFASAVALLCFLGAPVLALAGEFIGAAGNYGGILGATEPGTGEVAESGLIQVQVTESGALTGFILWQNQRYAIKGRLADEGTFSKTFSKKSVVDPVDLGVALTLSVQDLAITGQLTEAPEGASTPTLTVPFDLTGAPADPALAAILDPGLRVSFIDPPDPEPDGETSAESALTGRGPTAVQIPGNGFSQVRIGKTSRRAARIVGRLPDFDGAYSAGSPLRGSKYAVFSSLYQRRKARGGQLFGQATVQDNGNAIPLLQSQLRWGKSQGFDPLYYPGKIDKSVFIDALPYPKVKRGALPPLLPLGSEARVINARMTFRRGNLHIPKSEGGTENFFSVKVAITPFQSRIVGPNPYKVKIAINAFTGSFNGTFVHPQLELKANYKGAFQSSLLNVAGIGRGSFKVKVKDPDVLERIGEPLESGSVTVAVQ